MRRKMSCYRNGSFALNVGGYLPTGLPVLGILVNLHDWCEELGHKRLVAIKVVLEPRETVCEGIVDNLVL